MTLTTFFAFILYSIKNVTFLLSIKCPPKFLLAFALVSKQCNKLLNAITLKYMMQKIKWKRSNYRGFLQTVKFLLLKHGDFHVNQLKGYGQGYCILHPKRPIYNLKIIHKCKSVPHIYFYLDAKFCG